MQNTLSQRNGVKAEKCAMRFLKKKGYQCVTQNYACRFGEIDLIMEQKRQLVFVEVKYRKNCHHGNPEEFVTTHKQSRIITTAHHFLQNNLKYQDYFSFRFDILSISGKIQLDNVNWIKHAFIC